MRSGTLESFCALFDRLERGFRTLPAENLQLPIFQVIRCDEELLQLFLHSARQLANVAEVLFSMRTSRYGEELISARIGFKAPARQRRRFRPDTCQTSPGLQSNPFGRSSLTSCHSRSLTAVDRAQWITHPRCRNAVSPPSSQPNA